MARGYLTTLAFLFFASQCYAQETTPPAEAKIVAETFFSGTVLVLKATELTVRRRALVSNATTQTFMIDADTKIEGKLRVKANVTVRYVTDEQGVARATRIMVR